MRSEGRRPLFGGFAETFGDGIRVDVALLRILDGAIGVSGVFVLDDLVVGLPVGEFVGVWREQRRPMDEAFLLEVFDERCAGVANLVTRQDRRVRASSLESLPGQAQKELLCPHIGQEAVGPDDVAVGVAAGAGQMAGAVEWIVTAALDGVVGLVVGAILIPIVKTVMGMFGGEKTGAH